MWETAKALLMSLNTWSALLYLVVGAVAGAIISVKYSLAARRPRLIVSGGGSGGNPHGRSWRVNITNRPSFFGQSLDGESARDVHAHIRLDERKSQSYPVFWGTRRENRITIKPGDNESLELFHWQEGMEGYFIVDASGEPVAKFQDRELEFVVTLRDRLNRSTELRFLVEFDDTHLKRTPQLRIVRPITMRDRWTTARSGVQELLSACRLR